MYSTGSISVKSVLVGQCSFLLISFRPVTLHNIGDGDNANNISTPTSSYECEE